MSGLVKIYLPISEMSESSTPLHEYSYSIEVSPNIDLHGFFSRLVHCRTCI